jgi:hypothetical protein
VQGRVALLVLAVAVAACGGQVGTTSTSDGGSFLDAFTDSGAISVDSGAVDTGMLDVGSVVDSAPEAVAPIDAAQGCPAAAPSGQCSSNGEMCPYPGNACVCTSGCTTGECCPTTCPMLGFPCGQVGDGCGSILNCRTCPGGQACVNGVCGGPDAGCVVGTCPKGVCGPIDDGCGGTIQCGDCYWSCTLSGP